MLPDPDYSNRPRLPTLVQLCQRVASAHVDSIGGFGDEIRYELIKPILESCSPENLVRLEQASPHIEEDTLEIWKDMCFRTYPLAREKYYMGEVEEPDSWKDHYFVLRETEAKRLDEVGSRLRSQRLEADERKKEREIKVTDRVPPPKRARGGWSINPQPKTLFQKTRSEASKLQKNMYTARLVPPILQGKNYRVLPAAPSAKLPTLPSTAASRVTVKTVTYHRPPASSSSSTSVHSMSGSSSAVSLSASSFHSRPNGTAASSSMSPPSRTPTASASTSSQQSSDPKKASNTPLPPLSLPSSHSNPILLDTRPAKPTVFKKDPMAALFMPKHRAHSQRPR